MKRSRGGIVIDDATRSEMANARRTTHGVALNDENGGTDWRSTGRIIIISLGVGLLLGIISVPLLKRLF